MAWIDNASHVLWDVEKQGFAPKNEADWIEVQDHAIQLAAAGTVIQLPGARAAGCHVGRGRRVEDNARLRRMG